jgi:type IV secretion system protein VirB10
MIALGGAALAWYYTHALARPARTQSVTEKRVQREMALPSLGEIGPLRASADTSSVQQPPPETPQSQNVPLSEARLAGNMWSASHAPITVESERANPSSVKSPWELARERRLAGGVFARVSAPSAEHTALPAAAIGTSYGEYATSVPVGAPASGDAEGTLRALLKPSAAAAVQARLLPDMRFLLPKGAFIDCTLETAIDSTLPGMTTCVTAADTFGADGKVVLLERGSKLVGETRGQLQQGQARVFVVWTEARTPTGVVVPLDSPGTDELGRAGLPGEVDRHFWERFGAAMLISVVNGAVQAGVQAANHSGGAVIYAPSTSQDVMSEVLKSTVNIPPTVVKHNGDRIEVLVARDLDFRSVYELRGPSAGR